MTTLILSVFFTISASAYDVEVDGIYYNIIKKGNVVEVTSGNYSGDVKIPASISVNGVNYPVASIGEIAFANRNITSIDIPNSVTSIGESAFASCSSLTSIDIPNSVTSIGGAAFAGCSNITSIDIPNSVTSINDCTFYKCSRLKSVTIPKSVTRIGDSAFSDCSSLTSFTIPNLVSSIGIEAFRGCSSLLSITIPNSVTEIGHGAFWGCSSLTSVTIPNSISIIEYYVFIECRSLSSVTIPNSVYKIDYSAFGYCTELKDVFCYSEYIPLTTTDAFTGSYIEYATLHVPASAIDAYKTTEPWSGFGTFKTLEGTETEVETKKCETPIISFVDGKLTFSCATEDVEYVSEVKCSDASKYYTNEVSLAACYDISVTAMKTGYDNSDVATAKLYWLPSSGTLEGDNINNVAMRGIAIQSSGGFINISGLDNNEKVDFYGIDGKALGSAKSIDGNVSFSAKQGTVVVAKIGKESVKIAVE